MRIAEIIMDIRAVSLKELIAFVSSEAYSQLEVVPITPERAVSQTENPHAREDDIVLWIATSGKGRVIGFAGSLPAYDVHHHRRMGWNTCWWIDPERGRDLALPLFNRFLSYWEQHVAFADMTRHTYAIISQMNFCHTWEENLVHSYIRLSGKRILRKTGNIGKVLYPVIMAGVVCINAIQQIRMYLAANLGRNLRLEIREHCDEEIHEFILEHQKNDFLQRSMDEYKWIEDHHWLVGESEKADGLDKKYPFSYQVSHFSMDWVLSWQNDKIISVMFTSLRDGDMKLLYYFGEQAVTGIQVIMNKIRKDKRVQSILFCHPDLTANSRKLRNICLFSRYRNRYAGISKGIFEELPNHLVLQMGDGDSVFT